MSPWGGNGILLRTPPRHPEVCPKDLMQWKQILRFAQHDEKPLTECHCSVNGIKGISIDGVPIRGSMEKFHPKFIIWYPFRKKLIFWSSRELLKLMVSSQDLLLLHKAVLQSINLFQCLLPLLRSNHDAHVESAQKGVIMLLGQALKAEREKRAQRKFLYIPTVKFGSFCVN